MSVVRGGFLFLVMWALACLACTHAGAEAVQADTKLHALVIGNAEYSQHKLKNPANDAKLIDQSLRELGFEVTLQLDASQEAMEGALVKFARSVPKNGLALFYFAGHGVEVNRQNYLIPVDAKLSNRVMVKYKTISESLVLDLLEESGSNMNVVVLDCCRDNPFQRSWTRGIRTRGLAVPSAIPEGTLIAYATAPGTTASDGTGENSPYSRELARALAARPQQGLLLRDVFYTTGRAVYKSTGQRPWVHSDASVDRFYLRKPIDIEVADTPDKQPLPAETELTNITKPDAGAVVGAAVELGASMQKAPADKSASKAVDNSLLWQGDTFANDGNYDLAIETYTTIINESAGADQQKLRQDAYRARGSAYMQRGSTTSQISDYQRALIDYRAANLPGIPLAIRRDSANLMIKKDVTGKVFRFQTALVTQARKGWFWVESVQGNNKLQGWVSMEAFSEEPKAAAKKAATGKLVESKPAASSSTVRPPASSSLPSRYQPGMASQGVPRQPSVTPTTQQITNQRPTSQRPYNQGSSQANSSRNSGTRNSVSGTGGGYNNPNRPPEMTSRGGGQGTLRGQQYSGQGNRGGRGRRQFGR